MVKIDYIWLRIILTLLILIGLLYLPTPALSQETLNVQNVIRNGGFEQGVQGEFGVGYEWGGFSNGNAVVGWNEDTWELVVAEGDKAQIIEIKNAAERDRYAGIYQTVAVVPGQQYKLSLSGLVRSSEGSVEESDFGYRLQYAVDYNGGTAWELLADEAWQEVPWNEQPLSEPEGGAYEIETFDTTLTAQSDQLTIFIRGWKKWINDGSGIFNIDDVSLLGPTPGGVEAPAAQVASAGTATEAVVVEESEAAPISDVTLEEESEEAETSVPQTESSEPGSSSTAEEPATTVQTEAPLPVSGQGQADSINFVLIVGGVLLLLLLLSAVVTTVQWRRHLVE